MITLIIPVKDRSRLLSRVLHTVAAQTRRPDLLVIVDNDSSDSSAATALQWAETHPDILTVIGSESRPGASAARNRGLALAREAGMTDDDTVVFFDSDDIMLPAHIEHIAAAMARDGGETDLLYFDLAIRDDCGWTTVKSVAGDAPLMREQIFHSVLSTPRFAAKAGLLRRVGGWDEELPRWNDYELGIRLILAAQSPGKLTGEPTAVSLPRAESITGLSYTKDAPSLILALDKARRALAEAERSQDLRYLAARRAIVAALLAREGDNKHADILLTSALEGRSLRDVIACRLAYLATLTTGRGGAAIASRLLAPKRPKSPGKR